MAADIYVCSVNGTRTFVDSPRACPQSQAERITGPAEKAGARSPAVPAAAPRTRAAANADAARATTAAAPERVCDERQHATTDSLRACVKQERRAQVRRLATARLAAMARAIAVYVSNPNPVEPAVPVVFDKGRPAAWCEELLSDVMAQRYVDVVDDEEETGPRWSESTDPDGRKMRKAVEILDPHFEEGVTSRGQKVVRGYVTLRWRVDNLLVLRTSAGCGQPTNGVVSCAPSLYAGIYVHETEFPVACDVALIGHRYRNNWPGAIEIRPKVPAGLLR